MDRHERIVILVITTFFVLIAGTNQMHFTEAAVSVPTAAQAAGGK